jgi:potassium channel subfamily K
MVNVVIMYSIVAIEALAISRIEGWAYFDGIFFATVTMFTIGFGDFAPTHTASRVLVFIFALLTFAALGNQISIIAAFFRSRHDGRKARWQAAYEERAYTIREAEQKETGDNLRELELANEMSFLGELAKKQDMIATVHDMAISLAGFITFWVVGAAIFHALESWTYGTSVYFTCK